MKNPNSTKVDPEATPYHLQDTWNRPYREPNDTTNPGNGNQPIPYVPNRKDRRKARKSPGNKTL